MDRNCSGVIPCSRRWSRDSSEVNTEAELKRALPFEPISTLPVAFSVPARVGSFWQVS
jgi:hypothetical protein